MKTYLIRISCDGSTNDDLFFGTFDMMIDRFIELSYFGSKMEALEDETVKHDVAEIRDVENNWSQGRYDQQLEQGYIMILELQNENIIEQIIKEENGVILGIKLVRKLSKGHAMLIAAKNYVEDLRAAR